MTTKVCFKCNKEQDISNFYRHSAMKDGVVGKCKECNKKDVRDNRDKNLDYYREYDRKRGSRQDKSYLIKYREENPIKNKARQIVNYAKKLGHLVKQPCEVCGSSVNIHAHHCDYSKPLEVMWLCCTHHNEWHKNNDYINGD